jgi:aerobic-type carbon monoxide dehydrogenase small subunit (CoxS/CutS family)
MSRRISMIINGRTVEGDVEPRLLLADFIRDDAGLTGTHLGCEHGVCGACTVQLDGQPVRSCLMFAVQANRHTIATVEGMAPDASTLHPLQQAFHECHALQCGFCTPGILMTMEAFLREQPDPSLQQIRSALAGNLCRCTGYQNIITAVRLAADRLHRGEAAGEPVS